MDHDTTDHLLYHHGAAAHAGISALDGSPSPFDILTALEPPDHDDPHSLLTSAERSDIRRETLWALLDHVFSSGPDPSPVCRNIYGTAKAIGHPALAKFTLEEIGLLTGHGRAAASWRTKRIYNQRLQAGGATATQATFQKSETAAATYAAAAQGNRNRRRSTHRPRALTITLPS